MVKNGGEEQAKPDQLGSCLQTKGKGWSHCKKTQGFKLSSPSQSGMETRRKHCRLEQNHESQIPLQYPIRLQSLQ